MVKLVVIGAGSHSQGNHLPALARYVSEHPGEVSLVGLCDLRRSHAEEMAARYGFERVYVDLEEMLRIEQPDGCVAVTPIPATVPVATQVIRAGVPLLMEKPPGATAEEARQLVELVARTGAQVMVSMNRRFDPALRRALAWWGGGPMTYVRGAIVRTRRTEPEFAYGTAIHPLDAMRAIAGDVMDCTTERRDVGGVSWFVVRLVFEGGALGVLEVIPTGGRVAEWYEIFGQERQALVRAGGVDRGEVRCWERGEMRIDQVPAEGLPDYVRNGAYDETTAFIAALRSRSGFHPTPAEVLQSVELCELVGLQAPD
jgi:myo-inositol 2-dehydrogenase/D-chiro-inositol 1-dehydrogenase